MKPLRLQNAAPLAMAGASSGQSLVAPSEDVNSDFSFMQLNVGASVFEGHEGADVPGGLT
jgi:hypothetical protein